MNTRKMGKIFIVLMISLIAFGCGSCANALNEGNDITNGLYNTIQYCTCKSGADFCY